MSELTETQSNALTWFKDGDYYAGPDLPDFVLSEIWALSYAGLVQKELSDFGTPDTGEMIDGFRVHIGACWWFNLTKAGVEARAAIARAKGGE